MRRYFILAGILFSTFGHLFAQDITSQFDTDDEDWRAVQNNQTVPTYHATGGNPDGYISVTDNRSGVAWYWHAPEKYLGEVSSAYGGSLSFDLRQSLTVNQTGGIDIILGGGGLTLVYDTPNNPGTTWTSYSVVLNETAGWTKTTLTGPPPTQAEMLSVLSSLTRLEIRGEYSSSTSGDHSDLDNVVLTYNSVIANAGPDQTINSGESVTLGGVPTASGGTAPYTYSWSPANGLDNPNLANPTASAAYTTIYTVTVTDADNITGVDVVVVTVNGNTQQCITSFFDLDDEGWIVVGDAQGASVIPDYFVNGGNSGGYISALDDVTGGVWYWQAPAKFLDNVSCAYGGVLSFDLRQSSTNSQFNANDIVMQGGGLTLVFNTPNNPSTAWTSYSISLSETAGWRKTTLSGVPPTQAEMLAVLSSLQLLRIRGEYRSGADRGDLDNVVVTCNPSSTATVNGDAAICAGGSATISADLTGAAPWSLTWSDGVVQGDINSSPATRVVNPASTTTYAVTNITNANGCSNVGSGSATITLNPSPTAIVSGDATISVGGSATISAELAGAAPWSITWSDGITQNGIASSPVIRLVSPASTTTYTVTAVSDANCTGTASGSATVTVNPPPGGGEAVVLATNSVWLKEGSDILSGSVIVNNASSGPVLDSQVELAVGQSVTTLAGFALKANRIKVKQGAVVASDIFFNELDNNGTITGSQNTPLTLPVLASLPSFHQAPAGTQDITVGKDESITLTAGTYRDIFVKQNGEILFTGGGAFALRSLNTGAKVKLLFDAPTEILIEGKFDTDENSYVGPQDGSGIGAADIVFYVAGSNGNNGNFGATPKAAQLGLKNTVLANFYVPNGTLWLREGTVATGAFFGKDVIVGEHAQVTLESAFDSGSSLAKSADNESGQEKLISAAIPEAFNLLQNYPNPFNPSTTISFTLPEAGQVTLRVYSETGQLVRVLGDGEMNEGRYEISWDGRNQSGHTVAAGVYLCQLVVKRQNGERAFMQTRRMAFVK